MPIAILGRVRTRQIANAFIVSPDYFLDNVDGQLRCGIDLEMSYPTLLDAQERERELWFQQKYMIVDAETFRPVGFVDDLKQLDEEAA